MYPVTASPLSFWVAGAVGMLYRDCKHAGVMYPSEVMQLPTRSDGDGSSEACTSGKLTPDLLSKGVENL